MEANCMIKKLRDGKFGASYALTYRHAAEFLGAFGSLRAAITAGNERAERDGVGCRMVDVHYRAL